MVAYRFEDTDWGQRDKPTPHKNEALGDIRFRQLFEDKDWNRLPRPPELRRLSRLLKRLMAAKSGCANMQDRIRNVPSRKSFKAPNISKARQVLKSILARGLG